MNDQIIQDPRTRLELAEMALQQAQREFDAATIEYRIYKRNQRQEAYQRLEQQREEARASVRGLNPGKNVRQATPFSLLA